MKNSNDTIGNRTRYLPTCSAVTQPTAPLRVKVLYIIRIENIHIGPWGPPILLLIENRR
jgi:hypothetical protein